MKCLESGVERKVVCWAERRGVLHTKLNIQGRRGWPDRVFWVRGGLPLFIEFKRPGERPTKLQQHVLGQLNGLNYEARWTDKAEVAIRWLEERGA